MDNFHSYKNYNSEDFLEDDFFLNSIVNPTKESNIFWDEFIRNYPEKKPEIMKSRSILNAIKPNETRISASDKDLLWNNISKQTISKRFNQRRIFYWAAASVFLIMMAGISYLMLQRTQEINYASIKANISGTEDVKLVMSDQSQVNISNPESELKYDVNGKLIVDSKIWNLKKGEKNEKDKLAFNQLLVPRGKRSSITFSDGSKLWLNSGSQAIYPVVFENSRREIYIEGEAYLEVSHNQSWPFIVKTADMKVEVLGTSFNICAYPEEKTSNVVLVKGSVRASFKDEKKYLLSPNQMVNFNSTNKTSLLKTVDVNEYISWKEGLLFCTNEKLENVMGKLSRYYNREIHFTDEKAKIFKLSGKLDLKENINQVLHIICSTAPVKAEMNDKEIIISSINNL